MKTERLILALLVLTFALAARSLKPRLNLYPETSSFQLQSAFVISPAAISPAVN